MRMYVCETVYMNTLKWMLQYKGLQFWHPELKWKSYRTDINGFLVLFLPIFHYLKVFTSCMQASAIVSATGEIWRTRTGLWRQSWETKTPLIPSSEFFFATATFAAVGWPLPECLLPIILILAFSPLLFVHYMRRKLLLKTIWHHAKQRTEFISCYTHSHIYIIHSRYYIVSSMWEHGISIEAMKKRKLERTNHSINVHMYAVAYHDNFENILLQRKRFKMQFPKYCFSQ